MTGFRSPVSSVLKNSAVLLRCICFNYCRSSESEVSSGDDDGTDDVDLSSIKKLTSSPFK